MQTLNNSLSDALNRLAVEEAERPYIRAAGLAALYRLLPVAQRDSGQSGVVARFLLSLYNGTAYPFPLTDLRKLDTTLWHDCIAVLRLDQRPEQEVHQYIEHGEQVWDGFKKVWRA
ncbi:conserved protein of unknown function [Pseudomonas marincola]|uniref:DUF7673 domain-containing protein n=1 Tax=Pseudomonas marincola TaxID=437900 RepID=A0A653E9I0_9PSED|nr:hypothetical protein [Pseudomonas marincola]CAE6923765.1 conserved protein of unknown function [Pseudomonas marincola]